MFAAVVVVVVRLGSSSSTVNVDVNDFRAARKKRKRKTLRCHSLASICRLSREAKPKDKSADLPPPPELGPEDPGTLTLR